MKVTITHLKAPWPEGSKPGDVVEMDVDAVPGWALGKCTPAAEDAEVTASAAPVLVVNPAEPAAEDAAPAATTRKKAAPAA